MDSITKDIPICVDLDGTLIHTDMIVENLRSVFRRHPFALPRILLCLLGGRAAFKKALSQAAQIDYSELSWRSDLLAWLREQRQIGRKIYLATAADQKNADAIAEYLGMFDGVIASDGERNCKGTNKAQILVERFGKAAFDYIGDSPADVPVWRAARGGICVTPMPTFLQRKELSDKVRIAFVR